MANWSSGLCDCFNDWGICCYGFWCAPCLYGENAEKIDGSSCFGSCFVWWLLSQYDLCCLVHMGKRKTLRNRYRIQEDCNDCLVTTCCAACAICQEARELKYHSATSGGPVPVVVQPMVTHVYYPSAEQPRIMINPEQYKMNN